MYKWKGIYKYWVAYLVKENEHERKELFNYLISYNQMCTNEKESTNIELVI